MPACQARSASPSSANRATKLVIALTFEVAPSSALQADGLAAKIEIAPWVAPSLPSCCHWSDSRLASPASAPARTERETSIGPASGHPLRPPGPSADWQLPTGAAV